MKSVCVSDAIIKMKLIGKEESIMVENINELKKLYKQSGMEKLSKRMHDLAVHNRPMTRDDINLIFSNDNNYNMYASQFEYNLNQHSENMAIRIASRLINSVNMFTYRYNFTRKSLAHKFHCSIATINRALKDIKSIGFYDVYSDHIVLNSKEYNQMKKKEEVLNHDN